MVEGDNNNNKDDDIMGFIGISFLMNCRIEFNSLKKKILIFFNSHFVEF